MNPRKIVEGLYDVDGVTVIDRPYVECFHIDEPNWDNIIDEVAPEVSCTVVYLDNIGIHFKDVKTQILHGQCANCGKVYMHEQTKTITKGRDGMWS